VKKLILFTVFLYIIVTKIVLGGDAAKYNLNFDSKTLLKVSFDNYRLEGQTADKSVIPEKLGSPEFVPGYQGGGLEFKKTDAVIYDMGNNFNANEGTFECSFKLLPVQNRARGYVQVLSKDDDNKILLRFDGLNDVSMFIVNNKKSSALGGRIATTAVDKWYHLAFTWECSGKTSLLRLYVGGRLIAKKVLPFKMPDMQNAKMYLGNWITQSMPLNGVIDEVRLSNVVRYDKEIYPELISMPAIESFITEIGKAENALKEIQHDDIKHKLKAQLCDIHSAYNAVLELHSKKKFNELLNKYYLLKHDLSILISKVEYAQWWGNRKNVFEAIPYTCMHKVNGIWDNKYAENTKLVKLSSAGHEWQSFQVLIASNPQVVDGKIEIKATKLISDLGQIPADNIDFFKVGTIKPVLEGEKCRWADPLYPIKSEFEVSSDFEVVPVWVNIYVPKDLPAGDYKGQIILSSDLDSRNIDISLKVFGFSLPIRPRLKTAFGFSGSLLAQYENLDKNSPRFKS